MVIRDILKKERKENYILLILNLNYRMRENVSYNL